ncbi:membrane associated rhomboid family serine protease [Lipingzhangella halophila]|uniref:Membrane associated rhomboid family serine protease n=1 Tax=Lipingzhangella halophila TaxID=1783352 RepID=A0A7W7W1M9_9ACTN|nr:rhomboid family intramembrane serine protease [Lipingzhangella halophila]MBB4930826.1 membrane associated rhomboid family serine protease [Lipingzhangella halophila]
MAGIPLSDDYPVRRVPAVTYLLITANVAVYLLSPLSGVATWYGTDMLERACAMELYMLRWAAIPVELLSGEQLTGAAECASADFTKIPWVSSITSMYLHAGVAHLLGNMVYLFVFGPVVEDRLGRVRYLCLYTAAGVLSAYAFAITEAGTEIPLLGASGAISGVLGAYLVVQYRSKVTTLVFLVIPLRLPGWALVATYFVLQYFLYVSTSMVPGSEESGVAYAAHVYGFIVGTVAGLLMHRIRWRSGTRLSDVY